VCVPSDALTDSAGVELHVALHGRDDCPGTAAAPLATLEGARAAVRRLKRGGLVQGGVTVLIHAGRYPRRKPFLLGQADSGEPGRPIVYRALGDGPVSLCGVAAVSRDAFKPLADAATRARIISTDARASVLELDLRAQGVPVVGRLRRRGYAVPTPLPPVELFIDGVRAQRVRWPKQGHLRTGQAVALPHSGPVRAGHLRRVRFQIDTDRPAAWRASRDVWVDGVFSWDWAWSANKVAAFARTTRTLTLEYEEMGPLRKEGGGWFFFENILEELQEPGEYYVDWRSGRLYLVPPADFEESKPRLMLSTLARPLILLRDASFVTFRDLVLEYGRDVAVMCDGGVGNRFERCEIRNFGRGGLVVAGRSHRVSSCRIHDIGGPGVSLDGGDPQTLSPGRNAIENCHLYRWARWQRAYAPAVALAGVGNALRHSLLHDGPHMAVAVGGNDHLVEANEIHDVVKDFIDMGAIYFNLGHEPLSRGTRLRRNFIHHIAPTGGIAYGVYLDNATMGVCVEENVFYQLGSRANRFVKAVGGNGFAHVSVRCNAFLECAIVFHLDFYLTAWGRAQLPGLKEAWRRQLDRLNLRAAAHARRYPELLAFFEEDRLRPDTNEFVSNVIFNFRVPRAHTGTFLTRHGPRTLVLAQHNWIVDEQPLVALAAHKPLRLLDHPLVAAKAKGFHPILMEDIGPVGPVGPGIKASGDG
jgi:hypothetical protein